MIFATVERAPLLNELNKLPQSALVYQVLSKDMRLSTRGSIYGKLVNIVSVYGDFKVVPRLGLDTHQGDVIFVCTLTNFYAFCFFLRENGIEHTMDNVSKKTIHKIISEKFMCSLQQAQEVCQAVHYKIRTIMTNEDAVCNYLTLGKPIVISTQVSSPTYREVFYYLCGDPEVSTDTYLRAIHKYKHSGKHIIKFLRRNLELYIKFCLGEEVKKIWKGSQEIQMCRHVAPFLNLERAFWLNESLANCTCYDLLKVVKV